MTLLGNPNDPIQLEPRTSSFSVGIPEIVPPQRLEFIDPKTKKKRTFDVSKADDILELIKKGWDLFSTIRNGRGRVQTYTVDSTTTTGGNNGSGGVKEAGLFNAKNIIGFGVAAAIMLSLYMSLNKK